jgi:hypothetical protein
MSALTRSRRHQRRRVANASRRAAVLAIVSAVVLVLGQMMALADKPDDPGNSGEHGNGATASEHGQSQASANANSNAQVAAEVETETGIEVQRGGGGGAGAGGVNAADEIHGEEHTSKITICHATHAVNNPYVVITVAREAADGIAGNSGGGGDHYAEHDTEEVFNSSMEQGDEWGDIIPPQDDDGFDMPHNGLNWSAEIEANWSEIVDGDGSGCAAPSQPEEQPPPTGGEREISVRIVKTNDANEDGIFTDFEEARLEGQDVDFHLVVTNTSNETVEITTLTDAFAGTTIDLLDAECPALDGAVLAPGESIECTFTLPNYAPPAETVLRNVAAVCVQIVGGQLTACDDNPSRVTSAVVLGRTVTPTDTPPAPTLTRTPPGGIAFTGPAAVVSLAGLALAMLTIGTGLLWAGRRRQR